MGLSVQTVGYLIFMFIVLSGENTDARCERSGSIFASQRCYWAVSNHHNFRESHKLCQSEGGILAEIPDSGAQEAVNREWINTLERYWIGIHDMYLEESFVNMLNESITYTHWGDDQPNNKNGLNNNADCVLDMVNFGWLDTVCSYEYSAICSKRVWPLAQTTTESTTNMVGAQTTSSTESSAQKTFTTESNAQTTSSTETSAQITSFTTESSAQKTSTTDLESSAQTTPTTESSALTTPTTESSAQTTSTTESSAPITSSLTESSDLTTSTTESSAQTTPTTESSAQTTSSTETSAPITYTTESSAQTTSSTETSAQITSFTTESSTQTTSTTETSDLTTSTTGSIAQTTSTTESSAQTTSTTESSDLTTSTTESSVQTTSLTSLNVHTTPTTKSSIQTTLPTISDVHTFTTARSWELTTSKRQGCLCPCSIMKHTVIIKDETQLRMKIEAMKKALVVNKTLLSSSLRRKISAPDSRTSATVIGSTLGVAIIVLIIALVIASDAHHLYSYFKNGMCKCRSEIEKKDSVC